MPKNHFYQARQLVIPGGTLDASKQLAHLYELTGKPDSVVKYLKLTVTLNDSIFSNQKTREAQSFAFNEKLYQQELEAQKFQNLNKFRMYALLSILFVFLLVALLQYRNSKQKQHANNQLNRKYKKRRNNIETR